MRRKVLIVEDNDINREFLRQILEEDYEILEAENGVCAIEILNREREAISAVLLDLMMPEMDGFEVLERIRKNPDISQIPVIVATKVDDKETESRSLKAGANDYITKPYYPDIIRNRLINTIHLREQAAIVNAIKTDALTGLLSRAAFFEKTGEMIAAGEKGYYVLDSFDIDKFKVINDQLGSAEGDHVLRQIGGSFAEIFQKIGGIASRITADNFAALYPKEYVDSELIQNLWEKAAIPEGLVKGLSYSIGRYVVDDLSIEPGVMYDRACIAKESIKGRYDKHVAYFDEKLRNHMLEEQRIVGEMKQALDEGQFEVWYQPQFNHTTGSLIGAEALVRWRHPEQGLILPGQFIPLFEKNGFIYEVDKFVWEEACSLLKDMKDRGSKTIPVSVNISRYDIYQEDMIPFLQGLLKKYKLSENSLHLEITESAFTESVSQIIRVVRELKRLGFTVGIDDFGSGYSSLNTLKDVPADVVKLDMLFLGRDGNSEKGGNILESMVRMTRWLGMSVIAEGVETLQQADFLKSIGCNYIQGYLYSRPIPRSEYEKVWTDRDTVERMAALETVETYDNQAFWNPKSIETLIFNSFVAGACIFEYSDDKIEIIRVNDKYVRIISGDKVNSIDPLKINWEQYISTESRESSRRAMQKAIASGAEVSDEMELLGFRTPGDSVYLRATMRVIASVGNRYLFYCVLEDITEDIREDAQRRELIENLPCGAGIFDISNGNIRGLYLNRKYWKLVAREPNNTSLFPVMDYIKLEDRTYLPIAIQRMIISGKEQECEIRIQHQNGNYIPFLVRGNAVKQKSGRMTLYVTYTVIDEAEMTFRQMLPIAMEKMMASTAEYAFVKDRTLCYVCASHAFATLAGLEDEREVMGKTDYDLFEKCIAEKFRCDDQKMMKEGKDCLEYYNKLQDRNGSNRYFKITKYLLKDNCGSVIGLYAVGHDVTSSREEYENFG